MAFFCIEFTTSGQKTEFLGVYSSTPAPTVAASSEADERAALCALIVLLRDVHPLLEASKCWEFLGWRGERNTLTVLCSPRAAFSSSFLWGGEEELPEGSFRARRQLLCAGFPVRDVSGVHLGCGSDCREEGNHQMLVSEQKMAGRDARTAFLVWTSLVSFAVADG